LIDSSSESSAESDDMSERQGVRRSKKKSSRRRRGDDRRVKIRKQETRQMMDMLNKIAGKIEQMEEKIQDLNARVEEGGFVVGGTGEHAE